MVIAVIAGISGYKLQQHDGKPQGGPIAVKNPYVVPEKPLIGAVRPEFVLRDMGGTERNIGEWDGKIVVVNFWATWCLPCLAEIPAFIKLQEKYNDRGLQFVGIALHTADEITGYISEVGMNYPVLVGEEEATDVARSFGDRFSVLPYTVVIDRDRHIYFIRSGPIKYEEADAVINSIL